MQLEKRLNPLYKFLSKTLQIIIILKIARKYLLAEKSYFSRKNLNPRPSRKMKEKHSVQESTDKESNLDVEYYTEDECTARCNSISPYKIYHCNI